MRYQSTLTVVTALLSAAVTACAVPNVAAPAGETVLMTVAAHGVQIHECRAVPGAAPAWIFVAPEADLFDGDGRRIGRHCRGLCRGCC